MPSNYLYFEPEKMASLENLSIHVRSAVEGFITGLHKSPHKGFSVEFSEHREYTPGDDIRHLDWVAWGRSDRYYIKQYEQETNLRAHLLLDCSASMNWNHSAPITKYVYGCYLAASLAYLMTRQQDAVGMVAFDEAVRFTLPPGSSPAHLNRLLTQLEKTRPGRTTAIGPTFHRLAEQIDKRGLVIILSDLYDDPARLRSGLQHFVFKKHQVIVMHLLDPAEISLPFDRPMQCVDAETGQTLPVDPRLIGDAYRQRMAEFIDTIRRECSQRNIEYLTVPTDTPYDRLLLDYLARRRAMRR